MKPHFRTAAAPDVQAITALINAAFRVERFFIDGDRLNAEEVLARLGTGAFLLAEMGEALAGTVYVERRGERGYIGLLSVDPAQQRIGLGSQLMSAAEDHCRRAGCSWVDLYVVNLREELPLFYSRLGYFENGALPFPSGVTTNLPCHFVRMTKALIEDGHPSRLPLV